MKKGMSWTDRAFVWSAAAVALLAAIILDKGTAPHKWHAAIMWTGVAFYGVVIFSRPKWRTWQFWVFWAACLVVHVFAMWVIFGQLLPNLVLGTLYVIPLAFLEAIFLLGISLKLERNHRKTGRSSGDCR